ncbi:MAG: hypothetical protein ACE5ES_00045 [Candidatus Nanoarchaeia archaeon]
MEQRGETLVTIGGWYQRTTLHLTEVYAFMSRAESKLELNKSKLKSFQKRLNLKSVTRETGYLEHVKAITNSGIEIKYYEDGLYILETPSKNIQKSIQLLKNYFQNNFLPAISYIFSLGAPTPKILSNIQEDHPIVISKTTPKFKNMEINPMKFGKIYSKSISKDMAVYKTKDYIFITSPITGKHNLKVLTEMQIFFREFKDQLQRYLNIHRKVWEEISEVKEKKEILGSEAPKLRSKLDSYQKTIGLIRNRINQMGTYAHTRASLAKNLRTEQNLITLFQYKFEDLFNSLEYIKEVWSMTSNYVESAIRIIIEIDNKSTQRGIQSIQILAGIGVVSGVLGYLARNELPTFSKIGAISLVVLGIFAFIVDYSLKRIAKNKKYKLKFVERSKNI